MSLYVLLLLSGAPGDEPATELMPGLPTFDLKDVRPPQPCSAAGSNEIVVCGKRAKEMDIRTANPSLFQSEPIRAETALPFGGTAKLHAAQRVMPDGRISKAVMVTVKIPF